MSSLITSRVALCNGYSFSLILPSLFVPMFERFNPRFRYFAILAAKETSPASATFFRVSVTLRSRYCEAPKLCFALDPNISKTRIKKDSESFVRPFVHLRFTPAYMQTKPYHAFATAKERSYSGK